MFTYGPSDLLPVCWDLRWCTFQFGAAYMFKETKRFRILQETIERTVECCEQYLDDFLPHPCTADDLWLFRFQVPLWLWEGWGDSQIEAIRRLWRWRLVGPNDTYHVGEVPRMASTSRQLLVHLSSGPKRLDSSCPGGGRRGLARPEAQMQVKKKKGKKTSYTHRFSMGPSSKAGVEHTGGGFLWCFCYTACAVWIPLDLLACRDLSTYMLQYKPR